jgi:tripartite-type tricarboxylate transporter receptor subunit TctC
MKRILLALALAAFCHPAAAADWPSQPIKWIVPFPAGGQLDVVSRLVAERIAPALGQPIVIEVKTGASGNIGTDLAARAAPDGYTWLAASPPTTIQPAVRPTSNHNVPQKDFAPVAFIGTSPFLFVVPSALPVNTLDEFVAYAKAHRGTMSYAGSSYGTVVHLASEQFKRDTGIEMTMINYPGQPSAIADLLTGRVQFMCLGLILAEPQLKAGKLKALAILDPKRHPHIPNVPSVVELGHPDLVMQTWFGLAVPKGTPDAVIAKVNAEVNKTLAAPDVRERLATMGVDVAAPGTPADFGRFLAEDFARWKKIAGGLDIDLDKMK